MARFVIAGGGECGGRAALELRRLGFDGEIVLVGSEEVHPYERPPLSKGALLSGEEPRFIASAAEYERLGIELRLGVAAARIDRSEKKVFLADGRELTYGKLLIATGASPRTLPCAHGLANVRTLRTHGDAMRIRERLRPDSRLAIVGGGFIGLELAAAARSIGADTTVIEGQLKILSRGVPQVLAEVLTERHREEGVRLLLGARIETMTADGETIRIVLAGGESVLADVVVVGIGSVPNTGLAETAGLVVDNGIAVDAHLSTSDPAIFAAGDCCSFPSNIYGGRRIRLESWRNVQEQAQLAAANMMGAGRALSSVPWFWSDQYDLTLQVAGLPDPEAATVTRSLGEGAAILFQIGADGRLVSAAGLAAGNVLARDIRLAEMLIGSGRPVDPFALQDPNCRLKSLLSA